MENLQNADDEAKRICYNAYEQCIMRYTQERNPVYEENDLQVNCPAFAFDYWKYFHGEILFG